MTISANKFHNCLKIVLLLLFAQFDASAENLRTSESFSDIADKKARSQALFTEASKVIMHPRCLNCHPKDNHPRQGEDMQVHEPPVWRGEENHGVVAMRCSTCHQATNIDYAEIPGHPDWHLAPIEMAWQGLSMTEICQQVKDPQRNGGLDLQELHHHMSKDTLVGWAWHPGKGREAVPGTQKSFGELISAWIDTGAHCP